MGSVNCTRHCPLHGTIGISVNCTRNCPLHGTIGSVNCTRDCPLEGTMGSMQLHSRLSPPWNEGKYIIASRLSPPWNNGKYSIEPDSVPSLEQWEECNCTRDSLFTRTKNSLAFNCYTNDLFLSPNDALKCEKRTPVSF